jgi:hypothetical protein
MMEVALIFGRAGHQATHVKADELSPLALDPRASPGLEQQAATVLDRRRLRSISCVMTEPHRSGT